MGRVLRIANVSKSFYGLKAVRDISLDAPAGVITAVIGPNGAGKTTLFNCVTGVTRPDACRSQLHKDDGEGVPIAGKTPEELCRLGIARTFQQVRLFNSLSVVDNVMLATLVRHRMGFMAAAADRLLNRARRHVELRAAALKCLERVGLERIAVELAGDLDHGNRRRLEIARALASDPSVLLLDEPAAGMNHSETAALMRLLDDLRREGMAVLLIEHDMRLVMGISDRIYVMDHGELLCAGRPEEVSRDPAVIEAYLGSAARSHAPA
jgi:branched-chain amino acid transport system ATP-binding protein